MPADVRAALTATLVSDGGMSEEGAHKHLATMDAHKRYSVEVWS
jgi:sulfite reductase alpha subunit-like flavoprotein